MSKALLLVAYQKLATGTLTPDAALTTLIQLKTYRELGLRLQSKAKE
jgi:hypothetical protein